MLSEEEAKKYLDDVEAQFTYDCYDGKSGPDCHRLAQFYRMVRNDETKAVNLFKRNCDNYGNGFSCFEFGQHSLRGTLDTPPDLQTALKYYDKGCEADPPHASACHNAGLMRSSEEEFRDYPKAMEYFEKACDINDAESCFRAGSVYLTGTDTVPVNKQKGLALSKKACDLDYWKACKNIAVMYKKGDGVHQDDNKAKDYMDKAKTLYQEKEMKQKK